MLKSPYESLTKPHELHEPTLHVKGSMEFCAVLSEVPDGQRTVQEDDSHLRNIPQLGAARRESRSSAEESSGLRDSDKFRRSGYFDH